MLVRSVRAPLLIMADMASLGLPSAFGGAAPAKKTPKPKSAPSNVPRPAPEHESGASRGGWPSRGAGSGRGGLGARGGPEQGFNAGGRGGYQDRGRRGGRGGGRGGRGGRDGPSSKVRSSPSRTQGLPTCSGRDTKAQVVSRAARAGKGPKVDRATAHSLNRPGSRIPGAISSSAISSQHGLRAAQGTTLLREEHGRAGGIGPIRQRRRTSNVAVKHCNASYSYCHARGAASSTVDTTPAWSEG